MYFIELFGAVEEKVWLCQNSLFKYRGIESFKTYAQDQVDRAASKSVKEKLAERFQLKVALNKRDQWEQAIEQADLFLKAAAADTNHDSNSNICNQILKRKVNTYKEIQHFLRDNIKKKHLRENFIYSSNR